MKIDIRIKTEYIECGDLVYSKSLNEAGFIGYINDNYYVLNKNTFEDFTDGYKSLQELISKFALELIAKNKDLNVSMKKY